MKPALMQRTLDTLSLYESLRQPSDLVRADIVGRVQDAIESVQRDRFAGRVTSQNVVVGNIIDAGNADPGHARVFRLFEFTNANELRPDPCAGRDGADPRSDPTRHSMKSISMGTAFWFV